MVASEVECVQINHDAHLSFKFVDKIPHGIQHSLLGEKLSWMGQGDVRPIGSCGGPPQFTLTVSCH